MIGYKVMRRDGVRLVSGANSRLWYPAKVGTVLSMGGNGVYLSPNRKYVLDYYTGYHDDEVLLSLEFDPKAVVWGNLTDKESEVGVSTAKIVKIEELDAVGKKAKQKKLKSSPKKKKTKPKKRARSKTVVGLNYADVTGYVCDGDLYCLRHGDDNDCDPIFAGSEWDYQPHCSVCGDEIDVVVLQQPCQCEDRNCPVHEGRACRKDGSTRLYRTDMNDRNGVWVCEGCAEDMAESGLYSFEEDDNGGHDPECLDCDEYMYEHRETEGENRSMARSRAPRRELTQEEKLAAPESLRRLGIPSEIQRSGLPADVDPEAIERALQRGTGSDDEVLGMPRRKTSSKKKARRSIVGADPEQMTPALAQYRAQERGFPPLTGTPKDVDEGIIKREKVAHILEALKRVTDWEAKTAPMKRRYNELAQYRINDVEASFHEVTQAKEWTRHWAGDMMIDGGFSKNYPTPGGILRIRLILSAAWHHEFVLTILRSLMFTADERMGNPDRKTSAVKETERSLAKYRASVGRKTRVGAKYPGEATISPKFMRARYKNAEKLALQANDPNIDPLTMEWHASNFPEIVRQNPALPLIQLEDPARGQRIKQNMTDAMQRRRDQELHRVDEKNITNPSDWLAREKERWIITAVERFEENLWDSRSLDFSEWPDPENMYAYLDEDDRKHLRSQYKERWGGALSPFATECFFSDVILDSIPLARERVLKFAEQQGITIAGKRAPKPRHKTSSRRKKMA